MQHGNLRTTHFPYCLDRQSDGSYVLLNKSYQAVGFVSDTWNREGDKQRTAVRIKGLTPKKAAKISCDETVNLDRIYLYEESFAPELSSKNMENYLARLAVVIALETE